MEEKGKSKLTVVKDGVEEERQMNKPTPEETLEFKKEFEDAMEEFKTHKWEISEKGNFGANDVGLYLKEFLDKFCFWTKTGWMGVIKMREEIDKAMGLADTNTGLALDYQSLEFCAYMLTNPGGTGYSLALEFEKQADKYAKIATVVGETVEIARATLKNIQYLQEQWASAEQGFFLSELEPLEKEGDEGEEGEVSEISGNTIEIDLSKEKDVKETII